MCAQEKEKSAAYYGNQPTFFEVTDASEGVPSEVELEDIRVTLREECQNRVIDNRGYLMYECLASTVKCLLKRKPRHPNVADDTQAFHKIELFTVPAKIQKAVVDFLSKRSQVFRPVLSLLVENVPVQVQTNEQSRKKEQEKQLEQFFEKILCDCRSGQKYQDYIRLCMYAAATCMNTPIYILCTEETGQAQWTYFRPLFEYEGQPKCVIPYVTMYMSSEKIFYKIESHDWLAEKPKAVGLIGLYLRVLEDTSTIEISVPDELLRVSTNTKSRLCYTVSRDIVQECCELFKERRLIQLEKYTEMTAHRASRVEFHRLVTDSENAYQIVCQVLIRRREKTLLTPYVKDWNLFVKSCDYLAQFDALVALDTAVYERNQCVSGFVNYCQAGGQELDERRKKVTTAVIASSSVGIVSGGMIIAGIILAPVSFGASLGLSIAGGAIGVGTGVAAGSARTFEAVKQNTKLKDIEAEKAKIREKENRVAAELEKVQICFKGKNKNAHGKEEEGPGISLRGFLAVGSAFRASHSVAGIALAAVRLSTTAAAVSASILGPLSLVFDVAFLAEAAHNKAKGDKTNAGELLQTMAQTVDIKCKVFNSMLRGNSDELGRLFEWH